MMSDPAPPTGTAVRADVAVVVGFDGLDDADEVEGVPTADLQSLAAAVLGAEGVDGPAEMGLVFAGPDEIAELNREFRSTPHPTDVLSFPIDAEDRAAEAVTPTGPTRPDGMIRLVGDVVVCPSVAAVNAPDHAGSVQAELELLVVHGTLHLLGWDHADDAEAMAMQSRERELLLAHAARTGGPAPDPQTWPDLT